MNLKANGISRMKTLFLLAWTLACVVQAEPLPGYTLVWSDEFDGAMLDTNKWCYRKDSSWNSTQQPQNVSLQNGNLRIALKKEEARGKAYTGGGVISRRDFGFGYYEARLKVPATAGWHTSFWMTGYDENKPDRAGGLGLHELDVCEHDSFKRESYSCNVWMRKPKGRAPHIAGFKRVPTPDLTQGFHVWGCEFTPTRVRYFFDGQEVRSEDISAYETGAQRIWLTSIAANIGKKTGNPVDGELPACAVYDYVRFYQKKTKQEGGQGN